MSSAFKTKLLISDFNLLRLLLLLLFRFVEWGNVTVEWHQNFLGEFNGIPKKGFKTCNSIQRILRNLNKHIVCKVHFIVKVAKHNQKLSFHFFLKYPLKKSGIIQLVYSVF